MSCRPRCWTPLPRSGSDHSAIEAVFRLGDQSLVFVGRDLSLIRLEDVADQDLGTHASCESASPLQRRGGRR